jgi:hypothetical protein
MFLIPKHLGGLGEVAEVIEAVRTADRSTLL